MRPRPFLITLAVSAAVAAQPPIVALPAPTHPAVTLRIVFRAGSVDDPPGKEGLTALTAELMAEGGTVRRSAAELHQVLYPLAAEVDVAVDREMTVFSGRVHRDEFATFLPEFLDVLTRPRWDPKEFARLRDDAENELVRQLRTSDDEALGKAVLDRMLYPHHPYGHPIVGTVAGLRALTLDDVKAQAARLFCRARLIVGIAGGYPDSAVATLEAGLTALPPGAARPEVALPPVPDGPKVLIVEKEAEATAVSMGFSWELSRRDPDFPALWLAFSAFGEHRQFTGRLMNRLREQRGLNYGDYAYLESFVQDHWGTFPRPNIARSHQFFSIWLRPVEPANRLFALRAALYETDKLVKQGLTDDEVEGTKRFLAGYSQLYTQTDRRRLGYAIDDLFNGTPGHLAKLQSALTHLTTAQVNAAIRKWITPQRLRIAIVTKNGAELVRELASGEPSPIHYPSPKPQAILEEDRTIERFPLPLKATDIEIVSAKQLFEK